MTILDWARRLKRSATSPMKGFHGDTYLLALVDSILARCECFIETGTHVGTTLAYVARTHRHLTCLSCEPNDELRRSAEQATARYDNATILPMTSQEFLKVYGQRYPDVPRRRVFFWLDAHGDGFDWPLREEVQHVTRTYPSAYMMIDDFRVPDRPEFGFDEYDGQVCDFDYVKDSIQPGLSYRRYYPAYSEHTSPYHPLRGWVLFDIGHDQPLALPRRLAGNYRCVE